MKGHLLRNLLILNTICLLSGCSQTYTNSDGGSVTMSGDGKNMKFKSGDGKTTVDGSMTQTYPSNLPVPQYPGSTLTSNMNINQDGKKNQTMVQLNTPDKPPQIMQFYKDKLAGSGWQINTTVESTGAPGYLGASKGEQRLDVSVIGGEKDTCVSLTMQ